MTTESEIYRVQRWGEIANNLRAARTRAGWTQERVARHLGYSRAHVNRVEQAAAQLSVIDLELLAQAFGLAIQELLSNQSNSFKGDLDSI